MTSYINADRQCIVASGLVTIPVTLLDGLSISAINIQLSPGTEYVFWSMIGFQLLTLLLRIALEMKNLTLSSHGDTNWLAFKFVPTTNFSAAKYSEQMSLFVRDRLPPRV